MTHHDFHSVRLNKSLLDGYLDAGQLLDGYLDAGQHSFIVYAYDF